jgi:pseudouridine synthase
MSDPDSTKPWLSKRMGELGLCSRREADQWIAKGWLKVDGKIVNTLGERVSSEARIEVDRAATAQQNERVTILLVLTQDGRMAKQLIGQDTSIEKEYLVCVKGTLAGDGLQRLRHGLVLDGVKLKPAKVSWQNDDQLRFILREGRKRQIRRMCELVGLVVTGLKRVRSGKVPLGQLPVGQWRYLRHDESF